MNSEQRTPEAIAEEITSLAHNLLDPNVNIRNTNIRSLENMLSNKETNNALARLIPDIMLSIFNNIANIANEQGFGELPEPLIFSITELVENIHNYEIPDDMVEAFVDACIVYIHYGYYVSVDTINDQINNHNFLDRLDDTRINALIECLFVVLFDGENDEDPMVQYPRGVFLHIVELIVNRGHSSLSAEHLSVLEKFIHEGPNFQFEEVDDPDLWEYHQENMELAQKIISYYSDNPTLLTGSQDEKTQEVVEVSTDEEGEEESKSPSDSTSHFSRSRTFYGNSNHAQDEPTNKKPRL